MAGKKFAVSIRGSSGRCWAQANAENMQAETHSGRPARMEMSEAEAQAESELPFVNPFPREIRNGRNPHEVPLVDDPASRWIEGASVAKRDIGNIKMRRIREIERLDAELQMYTFREGELTENAEVPVKDAWPAQIVKAGISQPPGAGAGIIRVIDLGKSRRIVPGVRIVKLLGCADNVGHGRSVARPTG